MFSLCVCDLSQTWKWPRNSDYGVIRSLEHFDGISPSSAEVQPEVTCVTGVTLPRTEMTPDAYSISNVLTQRAVLCVLHS